MRRFLLCALVVAACGGPKKHEDELPVPEAPPDAAVAADPIPATLEAKVETAIGFLESLVTAATGAGEDCDKMSADMQAIADGPDGTSIIAMDADPEYHDHAKAVQDRYGDDLEKLGDRLSDAIQPCMMGSDKRVQEILVQIGLIGQ